MLTEKVFLNSKIHPFCTRANVMRWGVFADNVLKDNSVKIATALA